LRSSALEEKSLNPGEKLAVPEEGGAMRVVHVITGLAVGGAEAMLVKLLGRMDRTRFEPAVVSLMSGGSNRDEIVRLGIPVHELGMRPGLPDPIVLTRLALLARRLRPDLIQGWMYHGNLAALWAQAWVPGAPSLVWNIRHSLHDIGNEKTLTRAVIRLGSRLDGRARAVVCNSQVSLEQHARIGYRRDRLVMIPNGFDLGRFRPDPEARRILRQELGIPLNVPLVGMVARRHPMKGHEDFLRMAVSVKHAEEDARFLMVGRGVEPGDDRLEVLVGPESLSHAVSMVGERRDTHRVMAALDVLVVPSTFGEGFPNVLGEAMACCVPCVTTDVGDSAAVVGPLGRVVAPGRPEDLAREVLSLLKLSPEEREEFGRRCRKRVEDHFALDAIARRYEDLYDPNSRVSSPISRG
jgi:glycosyltransferase involved in cell wall biosynthesis